MSWTEPWLQVHFYAPKVLHIQIVHPISSACQKLDLEMQLLPSCICLWLSAWPGEGRWEGWNNMKDAEPKPLHAVGETAMNHFWNLALRPVDRLVKTFDCSSRGLSSGLALSCTWSFRLGNQESVKGDKSNCLACCCQEKIASLNPIRRISLLVSLSRLQLLSPPKANTTLS